MFLKLKRKSFRCLKKFLRLNCIKSGVKNFFFSAEIDYSINMMNEKCEKNHIKEMKRKKLQEIALAKTAAIVKVCMDSLHFSTYSVEPPSKSKKASAVLSVPLSTQVNNSVVLKIILKAPSKKVETYISEMQTLCCAIQKIDSAAKMLASEYDVKILCGEMLGNSCAYFFAIPPKSLFWACESKPENPRSFFDENAAECLGGGVKISALITQEQFFALEGFSAGSSAHFQSAEDNESFLLAMKYCNDLSCLHHRTPCYSLDGETSPEKWDDMILGDTGVFFCDKNADGFRLPTEMELRYLKHRQTDWCEYGCEFDDRVFPFICVPFTKRVKKIPVQSFEDVAAGVAFRVVFRD